MMQKESRVLRVQVDAVQQLLHLLALLVVLLLLLLLWSILARHCEVVILLSVCVASACVRHVLRLSVRGLHE